MNPNPADRPNPAPTSDLANPPPNDRRALLVLVSGVIAAIVLVVIASIFLLDWRSNDPSEIDRRDDAVADLLSWIPANEVSHRTFAVWTPDSSSSGDEGTALLLEQLAIEPVPRTLGHTLDWEERFGWNAGQVTSWAAAGEGAEIAVLDGDFDLELIEQRLLETGYKRGFERGVALFAIENDQWVGDTTGTDDASLAAVVVLLDGRLVTSSSLELARATIDVVLDDAGSLADLDPIAATLETVAPVNALVGQNQADHAANCLPALTPNPLAIEKSQYVIVGYGRTGEGGDKRTLVVATFADQNEATLHSVEFENGWIEGYANSAGAGGTVDAFGTLSTVSQTGALLIAELIDGRDDGWVRSGIQYAIPVCELTLALFPAISSDQAGSQFALSIPDRLIASLPLVKSGESQVVVDFVTLSDAAGVSIPTSDATTTEIEQWMTAIGPLPLLTTFPMEPEFAREWSARYGIDLESLRGVGETVVEETSAPVGVLIADWDIDRLTAILGAIGYDWIDLGEVRHFAYEGTEPASDLPNIAFRNLAIYGDRMWFSDDQQLMRDVINAALAE